MIKFKGLLFIIISLVVITSLIPVMACAPSAATQKPSATPSPMPTTAAPITPTPTATTPTAVQPSTATPKSGGVLRFPILASPGGFDPQRLLSYSAFFSQPVFNGLIAYDSTKRDLIVENIQPDLAEKWSVSGDGTVLTFNLRKNVKWHDGTPFTADDVIYSVTKMVDPKRSAVSNMFRAFDRIEKADDFTVAIYLKQASASFIAQLAGYYAVVLPKSKAETDFRTADFLMGTGPYKIKSYTAGSGAEFVKNTNYFKPGLPYLDGITISFIADKSAWIDALISNRIDMVNPLAGIMNQEALDRLKRQAPQTVVDGHELPMAAQLFFNLRNQYLKDVNVRKALAMLIDQKAMAIATAGNEDWGAYNIYVFPPAWSVTKAEVAKALGWDQPADIRVSTAKKLLSDANLAGGFKVRLLTPPIADFQKMAQVLQDTWRRHLSVEMEIVVQDVTTMMQTRMGDNWDINLFQFMGVTIGDPDELMNAFVTGGPANFQKYSNVEADKLWAQQTVTTDQVKRKSLVQSIERSILADIPIAPVSSVIYRTGWQPYVMNFVDQKVAGYGSALCFEKVWLNK